MQNKRLVESDWSLRLPVAILSAVAVICTGVGSGFICLAGEHPEHPTAAAPAETAVSSGVLDGQTFAGQIGKTGEQTGDADSLMFKDGTFVSTVCVKYGFNAASYVATEKDDAVEFSAEAVNSNSEKMSWKGVVRDGVAEATAMYQTATSQTEYTFKQGQASAAEAAPAAKKSEHPEHPK